jgi:hypothetical protein
MLTASVEWYKEIFCNDKQIADLFVLLATWVWNVTLDCDFPASNKTGALGWANRKSIIISQVTLKSYNIDPEYCLHSEEWNTVQKNPHKFIFFNVWEPTVLQVQFGAYLHQ